MLVCSHRHIYVCVCVCVYVCISTERKRRRETCRERGERQRKSCTLSGLIYMALGVLTACAYFVGPISQHCATIRIGPAVKPDKAVPCGKF
jgi:hypothetical protein